MKKENCNADTCYFNGIFFYCLRFRKKHQVLQLIPQLQQVPILKKNQIHLPKLLIQPQKIFQMKATKTWGTGTICLYTPGGSSENENIPIIFVDSETLIQIGLDSLDFDGSKLSYIYVDGMLATKEQLAHSQISLDLTGDMLSVGTHMVQVVQYDSDDPSGKWLLINQQVMK